jgi:uncharacterized protein
MIEKTSLHVKKILEGAEGGHDWYHTERVWKTALFIREKEGKGDLLTIELASLLHDISDPKFNGGDEEAGVRLATGFLTEEGLDTARISHIGQIIRNVSFKGGHEMADIDTIEFRIVQDADRLDALGAIGIARTFNYGGYKHFPIYDPTIPVTEYEDSGSYYRSKAPTINHFYEKLLKLKDLMKTSTGRALAEERHEFMLQFLERFYRECHLEGPDRIK